MSSDTPTKILTSAAAAIAGFGIAWAVWGSRSPTGRPNPSGKPAPLIKYLENVDSYVVSPKEKWISRILSRSNQRHREIAHPGEYEWRMYASVPVRFFKDTVGPLRWVAGDHADRPVVVNRNGTVISGSEMIALQKHLGEKTVQVIVATPIDKDR